MSDAKRWIIVEMRNGNVHNLLVDANISRETAGEWLPYFKKLSTTDKIKIEFHAQRHLVTPKGVDGTPVMTYGPTLQPIEGVDIYGEDRAIRIQDIVEWSDASDYWAEVCDTAYEQDMKAWKSALKPGPRIVTATSDTLDKIGKLPVNGVPRMPRLPE